MLHLLVADGNDRDGRARHAEATGSTSAESYAAILGEVARTRGGAACTCTLISPADADAVLPAGMDLSAYAGLVVTGSTLKLADGTPETTRQIALMRAALAAGLSVFGSCWGMQVAAVATGGAAGPNPKGGEYGFARALAPTRSGHGHPLLAGRPDRFDAPAIHGDAVLRLPAHATLLASNACSIQAIEIVHGPGVFWGTQYHPETDLDALGIMLRMSASEMIADGQCPDAAAVAAFADDLARLHADRAGHPDLLARHRLDAQITEDANRRREIGNFLDFLAVPRRAAA
ncbi:type 1 glutamine amidotransferase [Methylobacterium sp. WL69]|uniref:glutamine amidotransferase-related protein n=1 Tax=Methylobacterium sp. WL69 TaxID=2603893 RepID=UPI0011C7D0B7|nr:gamma-glutamyl-gamma-aminobutyrate hydrolase family protein [Methylobacterium sp. WL69]TXM69121.1 type 1 glutamine amidotransferase [Methylobacterium sp. WL69]